MSEKDDHSVVEGCGGDGSRPQETRKPKPKIVPQTLEMLLSAYPDKEELSVSNLVDKALANISRMQGSDFRFSKELGLFGSSVRFFMISHLKNSISKKISVQRGFVTAVCYKHSSIKAAYFLLQNITKIIDILNDEEHIDEDLSTFEWNLCAEEQNIEITEDLNDMLAFHDQIVRRATNPSFVNLVRKSGSLDEFVSPFSTERRESSKKRHEEDDEEEFEEDEDEEDEDEDGVEVDIAKKKRRDMNALDDVIKNLNKLVSIWKNYFPHYLLNHLIDVNDSNCKEIFIEWNKTRKKTVLNLPCRLSVSFMQVFMDFFCTMHQVFACFRRYSEEILDKNLLNTNFIRKFIDEIKSSINKSVEKVYGSFMTGKMPKHQLEELQLVDSISKHFVPINLFLVASNTFFFTFEYSSKEVSDEEETEEENEGTEKLPEKDFMSEFQQYMNYLNSLQPSRRLKVSEISVKDIESAYSCMGALIDHKLLKNHDDCMQVYQSMRNLGGILTSGGDSLPEPLELKSVSIGKLTGKAKSRKKRAEEESGEPPADPEDPQAAQSSRAPERLTRASREIDSSRIIEGERQKHQTTRFSASQYKTDPKPRNARNVNEDPFSDSRKKGEEIPGMDRLGQKGVNVMVVAAEPTNRHCKKDIFSDDRYSKRAQVGVFRVLRKCDKEDGFYEVTDKVNPEAKDILRMHKDNLFQILPVEQKKNVVVKEGINQYDASNIDRYFMDIFKGNALFQEKDGKTFILGTHEPFTNEESDQLIRKTLGQLPNLLKKEKKSTEKKVVQAQHISRDERRRLREERAANPPSRSKRTGAVSTADDHSSDGEDSSEQRASRHTSSRGRASSSKGKEDEEDNYGTTVYSKHPFHDNPVEFYDKAALIEAGLRQVQDIAARSVPGKYRPKSRDPGEGRESQDEASSDDESLPSDDEGSDYDPNDENDETQGVFRAIVSDQQRQTRSRVDNDLFTDEMNKQYYPYNPTTPCILFFQVTGEKESKRVRVFLFPRKMRLTEKLFLKIGELLAGTGCWEADAPFIWLSIKYNTDFPLDPSERSIALCDITLIDPKEIAKEFWVVESDGSFRQNLWELIDRYVNQELECASWTLFTLFVLCPYDKETWRHGVNERCMCKAGKMYRDCLISNHSANQYCQFRPEILTGIPPCCQDRVKGRRMTIVTPLEAQSFARAEPCSVDSGQFDCEVVQARYVGTYPSRDSGSSDEIERPATHTAVALPSQPETQATAAQEQVTRGKSRRATAPAEADTVVTRRSTRSQHTTAPKKT